MAQVRTGDDTRATASALLAREYSGMNAADICGLSDLVDRMASQPREMETLESLRAKPPSSVATK